MRFLRSSQRHNFYPRPPRGGRHLIFQRHRQLILFLSTPSARRATIAPPEQINPIRISIHALREEGDPRQIFHRAVGELISIHALREEGDV